MALMPAASLAAVDAQAWADAFGTGWAQEAVDWKLMHEETDGELLLEMQEEGLYVSVSEAMGDIEYFAKIEMADMTDAESLDASDRMAMILKAAVLAHAPETEEAAMEAIFAGLEAAIDEAFSSESGEGGKTEVEGWYIKAAVDDEAETLSVYMSAKA